MKAAFFSVSKLTCLNSLNIRLRAVVLAENSRSPLFLRPWVWKERYLLIWTSQWRKLRPNPSYYHQFTTSLLHRHHQTLPGISTKVYCFHLSEVLRAYVPIPTAISCSDLFIVICRHHSVSIFAAIHVTIGALLTIEGERRYNGPDRRVALDLFRVSMPMGSLISTSRSAVLKKMFTRGEFRTVLLSPPPHVVGVLPMILQRDRL